MKCSLMASFARPGRPWRLSLRTSARNFLGSGYPPPPLKNSLVFGISSLAASGAAKILIQKIYPQNLWIEYFRGGIASDCGLFFQLLYIFMIADCAPILLHRGQRVSPCAAISYRKNGPVGGLTRFSSKNSRRGALVGQGGAGLGSKTGPSLRSAGQTLGKLLRAGRRQDERRDAGGPSPCCYTEHRLPESV